MVNGATKTGAEWSKYWVDFKAKLKRKNRLNTDARNATGGGPSTEQPLTEIERKFLSILGRTTDQVSQVSKLGPAVTEEIQSRHETDRLSQPSTATDGNPVYLDISFDDSDHQYQSPNIIETIEEPINHHLQQHLVLLLLQLMPPHKLALLLETLSVYSRGDGNGAKVVLQLEKLGSELCRLPRGGLKQKQQTVRLYSRRLQF
ncbi:hypothetical protein ACJJTC_014299 [Scirpophaga incertulas]